MDRNFAFTATLLSVNDKISINGICGETSSSSKGEERLDWREKGRKEVCSEGIRFRLIPTRECIFTNTTNVASRHRREDECPENGGNGRSERQRAITLVCVCVWTKLFFFFFFFFSFSRFRSKRRVVVLLLSYYFKFRLVFFAFEERRGSKERETGILPLFSSIHIKWTN